MSTMKGRGFLINLHKRGMLELVDPSKEIEASYKEKSKSNLESAQILFKSDKLEEAVSLAYFSMYNMLMALFFKTGIKSESHIASIILMREIFGLDETDIKFAKEERKDKQYYVGFHITKKQVQEMFRLVSKSNTIIADFMAKLTNEGIKMYRDKFNRLLQK